MRRKSGVTAFLLLTAFVAPAGAQSDTSRQYIADDEIPYALLDRPSRFMIGWPSGALYEGDLMVPIHLFARTQALRSIANQNRPYRSSGCSLGQRVHGLQPAADSSPENPAGWTATGCSLAIIPHVQLRQLSGLSAPVRNPSFNPALEFTWYRIAVSNNTNARRMSPEEDRGLLFGWQFRLAHYSNGQSNCLFSSQHVDAAGNCVPAAKTTDVVNTANGDFSTHYVEVGVVLGSIGFAHDDARVLDGDVEYIALSERYHPPGLDRWGGMSDDLALVYGRFETVGHAELRRRYSMGNALGPAFRYQQQLSLILDGDYAAQRPSQLGSFNSSVALALTFPGLYGFGFVARRVSGWDYYNSGFENALSNGRAGVAFGIILQHSGITRFSDPWPK